MHRPATMRLVGVLGGMGPMATVDFMAKVIAATPAAVDQDHVPLLVYSLPQIPSRTVAIRDGTDAPFLPMLAGLRVLEAGGAEIIAIPCNTAHCWYDRLSLSGAVEIIHIADAVLETIERGGEPIRQLALMATRATIATGIYDRVARIVGSLVVPDDPSQHLIDRAVAAVKANDLAQARHLGREVADRLIETGCDRLLLACTELPIALADSPLSDRMIDATDALARACVRASMSASTCTGVSVSANPP